ncbi:MAG: PrpF domain-containing protein [Pseudomonadota bacterium]|nr:PrpF domain-containing protein [Pseudomonadota bacterium]
MAQKRLPAVLMRGGSSKGLFFGEGVLPTAARARDSVLIRALGSPDPYGTQMDGLGGGTSSTSKVAIVGRSSRPDCDVDYWFGHVAIQQALVDDSGSCGNLAAAVGPFAIEEGLVETTDPMTTLRIWQRNVGKRIVAEIPTEKGVPRVSGDFRLDGVAFPGAAMRLIYLNPNGPGETVLPTGQASEILDIAGWGPLRVSLLNAGNPIVFVRGEDVGLTVHEGPRELAADLERFDRFEAIRSHAAVAMGLASTPEEATRNRPATPKLAFVAPPGSFVTSDGCLIDESACDILGRILSMGRPHHAFTGTGAIAVAVAAKLPGTVIYESVRSESRSKPAVRLGHAAGVMSLDAHVEQHDGIWRARSVSMYRSARRLMEGAILIPEADFEIAMNER